MRYYSNSDHAGQITLKYIILPGLNDNLEDYLSLIEIMKILEVKHLTISRDIEKKYSDTEEQDDDLIGAAAYLLVLCHKNGITNDMFTFSPEERQQVVKFANELLRMDRV